LHCIIIIIIIIILSNNYHQAPIQKLSHSTTNKIIILIAV